MRAAIQARQDPDLVIAGRTSAPAITDAADAAIRLRAYEESGVDALFVVGIKNQADLEHISKATSLPLILGSAPSALRIPSVLEKNRVRICLLGHKPFAAATQALYDTMRRIKEGEDPANLPGIASDELMKTVTNDMQYGQWSSSFLDYE